jgi:SAM-dependent methyltransferase
MMRVAGTPLARPATMPGMDPRTAQSLKAYDASASDYLEAWREKRLLDAVKQFGAMVGRGGVVLDVACGPALDTRLLRDQGLRVASGDLSWECMRVGKTLHPKGALARWDFRQLPFADNTFDGVWAPAALQHLPRAEIRPTLREWRRVQRRGPIFVTFPRGDAELEPFDDPPAGEVFVTKVSVDEVKALLLAEGYEQVEIEERPDLLGRSDVTWIHAFARLTAR